MTWFADAAQANTKANASVQRHRPLRNMRAHIGDDAPRWRLCSYKVLRVESECDKLGPPPARGWRFYR